MYRHCNFLWHYYIDKVSLTDCCSYTSKKSYPTLQKLKYGKVQETAKFSVYHFPAGFQLCPKICKHDFQLFFAQ